MAYSRRINSRNSYSSFAGKGLFAIAFFFSLYFMQDLLLPIFFAFIFYFLLHPVVDFLKKKLFIPKIIGSAMIIIVFLIIIGYAFYYLSYQAEQWMKNTPQLMNTLSLRLEALAQFLQKPFSFLSAIVHRFNEALNLPAGQKVQKDWFGEIFTSTWQFLIEFGIMIVFLYFLLASEHFVLNRLITLAAIGKQDKANKIVREIEKKIWTYLFARTMINIGVVCIVSMMLYAFEVPNPVLWGVMAGILEFIPFIGALISLIVITAVSIVSFDNFWYIISIPFTFFVFISLEGNVFVPYVFGKNFSMNTVIIVLGIFFMSWLWGILGSFLALPILIITKIILENIDKENFSHQLFEE